VLALSLTGRLRDGLAITEKALARTPADPQLGAAVGAIAGDAGKGAAAGAVLGGVRGRRQSMAAQQAQQQETRSAYDRAFAACMEGRGYTVR